MTGSATVLAVTEQRAWTDSDRTVRGRQRIDALTELAGTMSLRVLARRSAPEANGLVVLPGAAPRLVGPSLLRLSTLRRIWHEVGSVDVVAVPVPGVLGGLTGVLAWIRRRPVVALVVGNGQEVAQALAPDLGPRRITFEIIHRVGRFVVRRAATVRYVTVTSLQEVYPPAPSAKVFAMTDAQVALMPVTADKPQRATPATRIVAVGTLDQPYKGMSEIIQAVHLLRKRGEDVELTIIGDGRLRPQLESMATRALGHASTFLGGVYGRDLEEALLAHDLLVQGSYTEGMSRVVVEAIALGLPVVATDVGGTQDVVDRAGLVRPRDVSSLADCIHRHLDPDARRDLLTSSRTRLAATLDSQSATRSCFAAAVRRRAEGDPPRVLHVFGVMDRGGAEMRTIELTEGLGADVDAHFLTLRGRPGVLDARIRTTGGRIHPVPLGLSFPLRYLRLLRQVRPDVIDSHVATFSGVLLVGAWAAGVPRRIAHFRSDGDDHGHSLRRRVQRSVMRWLIDRSATDIIGVSPSSLSAGYRATWSDDPRCRVIPNGIREALSPTEINLRHALEIPDDALLIMHVGRPSPEKNRSRLPGILRHVAGRHPAHLVLVGGEGDDEDELSSAITTSAVEGLVHHLGSIDGVREVMAQADVLVQPSLREGLPGVVLEAASVGTPVVSSDVPGATWIEEHVPTVRTLPLAQSDSQWASSVIAAAKDGPTRNEARSAFRDSIFTFDASRQTHAQIWRRP